MERQAFARQNGGLLRRGWIVVVRFGVGRSQVGEPSAASRFCGLPGWSGLRLGIGRADAIFDFGALTGEFGSFQ